MNDTANRRAFATALRGSGGEGQALQQLSRTALKSTVTNAIDHARMAQRVVAVLIITLARSDRLDAMVGVPTSQIMPGALGRVIAALRPVDRIVQLSDEKICVVLPNLRSDALPLLAARKIQQAFESPFEFDEGLVTIRPIIGIAAFPAQAENAEELLVHADIAKRTARNRDIAQ